MGLAGLLIVLGIVLWLLFSPLLGLILLALGLLLLVWSGALFTGGPRRYWY
jgi:hypothetical protein